MKIETTHLYSEKENPDKKYRWFETHDDNCNAAKSNKNRESLIRCNCSVAYDRIEKNE